MCDECVLLPDDLLVGLHVLCQLLELVGKVSVREHPFFRRGSGPEESLWASCKISQPSLYIFC